MEITKTYNWNRRDFYFDDKCEFCGHVTKNNSGYDDSNYYDNVVPDKKCPGCGKSTNSEPIQEGVPKRVIIPKYNPNMTL